MQPAELEQVLREDARIGELGEEELRVFARELLAKLWCKEHGSPLSLFINVPKGLHPYLPDGAVSLKDIKTDPVAKKLLEICRRAFKPYFMSERWVMATMQKKGVMLDASLEVVVGFMQLFCPSHGKEEEEEGLIGAGEKKLAQAVNLLAVTMHFRDLLEEMNPEKERLFASKFARHFALNLKENLTARIDKFFYRHCGVVEITEDEQDDE
jgi:hypothetical protein